MRTITIDFTSETIVSSYLLGKIGEHNATKIICIPPLLLSDDDRVRAYRIAFGTGGKTILSESYSEIPFEIEIWKQLTECPRMSIQIIAYDGEGEYVGKSDKLSGFYFESSISGAEVEVDGSNPDLAGEIIKVQSSIEAEIARATEEENLLDSKKVDKVSGKGLSANDFTDAKKQKLEAMNVFFGSCLTAAGTTKKTIITDSQFELREGVTLVVYFSDGCSVAIPVFNVNSTGEHSAYRNPYSTSELALSRISAGGIGVFAYYNGRWYQPNLFNANGTNYGVVSLSDSTNSASDAKRGVAATPKAVKTVADIANAKQDSIADLQAIRSGAALGATATQPSDLEAEVTAREDGDIALQDQINNLKARGRFLSLWNATTGLAMSEPSVNPYEYRTGDYFIVEVVGTTNYKPSGTQYDKDVPSTAVETDVLAQGDSYFYDGTTWILQKNTQMEVSFSSIAGSPFDNTALASVLNSKLNKNQGTENVGKAMIVGPDGNLTPSEIASPLPLSVVDGKLCITFEEV